MPSKQRNELVRRLEALVSSQTERIAKSELARAEHRSFSLDELRNVGWLADALKHEKLRQRHWPLVAVFSFTAVALTVLLGRPSSIALALRARTTDIEFDLATASKSTADVYLISQEFHVSSLEFAGQVAFSPSQELKSAPTFSTTEWQNLRIEHVYVEPWPNQTPRVAINAEAPNALRLCVSRGDLFVDFAGGKLGASQDDREIQVHVAPLVQPPSSPAETSQGCARWESSAGTISVLSSLPVAGLHVSGNEISVAGENDRSEVFQAALQSATVTFPAAPGLKNSFERDERLGLTGFRGRLAAVSLSKGFLDLRATGTAVRVTRSTGVADRNIVPSRLSILKATYSEVWFAWGLLLYLVSLIAAFLKWRDDDL